MFLISPIKAEVKPVVTITITPTEDGYYNVEITRATFIDECEIEEILKESINCKTKRI
jgi:hypothetical protein